MRRQFLFLPCAFIVTLLAGCAITPADRIRSEPVLFARYSVEVQERIRAGRVEVGDDADAVWLALGEPHRRVERTTAEGRAEVWIYLHRQRQSRVRLSLGVGMGMRHSGVGAGIGMATGDVVPDEEATRVEFSAGRVVRVETRKG